MDWNKFRYRNGISWDSDFDDASFDSYGFGYDFDSLENPSNSVTAVSLDAESEHVDDNNPTKTLQILQSVPLDEYSEDCTEFVENVVEIFEEKRGTSPPEKPLVTMTNVTNNIEVKPEVPTKVYVCDQCEKVFRLRHHLNRHKLFHTEEKPFQCETCSKCFKTKGDLVRHEKVHLTNRPITTETKEFTCQKCGRGFSTTSQLTQHSKIHASEVSNNKQLSADDVKSYKCESCFKCFLTQSNLISHKKLHLENPFFCEPCQKFFSSEENLKKHNLIHSENRKYKCATCKKGYNKPADLAKHEATHTDVKFFLCKFCNKAYTQKYHRDRHEKAHNLPSDQSNKK